MTPPLPIGALDAPTLREAYSDRRAALLAACSQVAYETARRPLLAAGGLHLRAETADTVLATAPGIAVLAFRGSCDAADWEVDLSAELEQLPGAAAGVRVHSGFLARFNRDRVALEAAIGRFVPPDVRLFVAGHSLGGAVAQIATAALDRPNLAACYTFGSPRVATVAFDQLVRAPHYRVVNGWDPVPSVPGGDGYRHCGDPRLLTGDDVCAYHRDRSVAGRMVADLAGALHRDLFCAGDHAIGLYRARLELIAAARAGSPLVGIPSCPTR